MKRVFTPEAKDKKTKGGRKGEREDEGEGKEEQSLRILVSINKPSFKIILQCIAL